MDLVWAPWRVEYIRNPGKGCFLCTGCKSNDLKGSLVLERNDLAFTIMNRFPYNSGHLMVAPVRHAGFIEELHEDEILEINRLLVRAVRALKSLINPDGFNIGINQGKVAGAGVIGHIHYHLVPRWQGDTNFMPILTDTKVVVEALHESYDKLKQALKDIDVKKK